MEQIVVVGLSLAGLRCVETLRRAGYAGRVVAIHGEAHLPYDRPPLSKELLAGTWEPEQMVLRRDGIADLEIDVKAPSLAIALDVEGRTVELDDGSRVPFDGLAVATGMSPRRLPNQPELDGVHVLRTLDDSLAIRARLDAGARRVVVIGAGFIGSEVASTCRERGLDVTVLEALDAPMVRGLGPVLGHVCGDLHRDHGVDLRLGVAVEAIEGGDRVERVLLADGDVVDADIVVVGIGVAPNTGWLESSGLALDNGVVCDETCRAAPGIVVAGDVCRWPNPLYDGESMRLEHWTNATEQGVHAAHRLLAEAAGEAGDAFTSVPFVWSDQYETKIQTVGWFSGDDEMHVAHGSLADRKFVALFGRAGRLVGALGFSSPRLVMQYRRLIAERASWDDALAVAAGA
jgi:3-phenylpropionate/trans-cinnamate dioxygenase ferredoxin reductase subunit